MSTILDLFDPEYLPNREFERTIQPDDPATLYRDLRDYVLPPEVRGWLTDQPNGFIHQFLASVNSVPDAVRTWITGFFGSGKSHLLKVLAHLLCNTTIRDPSGLDRGAAQFLCERLGFGNLATLITGQLVARPLIIQMLSYARSERRAAPESSISYIILSQLERSLGRSAVPWIAQFEQLLSKNNQFDAFQQFVSNTTAADGQRQEWQDVKDDVYLAHPLLVQGLNKFLSRTYKTAELTAEAVRLAETRAPDPESVVRRLVLEAKAIDPHKGRLLVCLDEVRLYLGDKFDRITELQAVAEKVKSLGQGKVFLIVTGQESPEDVDSRFHEPGAGIGILADRFPEKFRLSENNIDYVVCQRLLHKSDRPAPKQMLRDEITPNRPQLATAACIRNPLQNPDGRFTNTEPADLARYYPLLPYHVILLQEILTRLRSTGPSGGVVGTKERAILIIIRSLFGEPGNLLLGAAPVGTLATFDRIYDVLEEELKGIHLSQRDQVAQIQQSGDPEAPWLAAVAKAVLLVQQAARRYFRVTEDVVAAVLYPRLGAEPHAHTNRVKDALKKLSESGLRYLTQDPELGYRFLTETETRFEKIVAEQDVTGADRFGVLKEAAEAALKKKFFKHDFTGKHGKRKFEVKVFLEDRPGQTTATLASGSHLELRVLTPTAVEADPQWADVALLDSTDHPERLIWSIKDLGRLTETVERIVRVRKALPDSRLHTTDAKEQEQIEAQRQRVEKLAQDDDPGCLPAQILQGLSQGTLVWNGEKRDFPGIPVAEDIFRQTADKALKAVFTEFDHGSALVMDPDLRQVLTWTTTRPVCVQKLELMDQAGKVLLERPVLKAVVEYLRRPENANDDKRKGEALATAFDAQPHGWEEHVVRAALAALLRAGAVIVREGPVEVRTSNDAKAAEIFSGWNRFKKAVFEYAGELTPGQRQAATQALHTLFNRAGEDTFEKIDHALGQVLQSWLPEAGELVSIAQATQLPCRAVLEQLRQDLQAVRDAPAGTQRIVAFLQAERQARLAVGVHACKALRDFRAQGSLDRYQKIRSFVAYPTTPFVQRVGSAWTVQLDSLKANLNHPEFYAGTRWAAIIQTHDALRQAYSADYRHSHRRRQDLAAGALSRLQGHRNWSRFEPPSQQELLRPFQEKLCSVEAASLDEGNGFVCPACRADGNTLAAQVAGLPGLEVQAQASLDALDAPPASPPDHAPGVRTTVVADGHALQDTAGIAPLAESLKTALTLALAEGGVTVDIRIHTRAGKGA
jgi:hypothetical protein